MNDMRVEPPTGEPPPPSPPNPDEVASPGPRKGSIVLGFGLAWLIVVGGHILMVTLSSTTAYLLPEAAVVAVGIAFAVNGKSRSTAGIFIGLATMFAVVLLLIAACFGLMSNGGFMH